MCEMGGRIRFPSQIDEITLPYTTKANAFSLFLWLDPCDTSECQLGVRWIVVSKYHFLSYLTFGDNVLKPAPTTPTHPFSLPWDAWWKGHHQFKKGALVRFVDGGIQTHQIKWRKRWRPTLPLRVLQRRPSTMLFQGQDFVFFIVSLSPNVKQLRVRIWDTSWATTA